MSVTKCVVRVKSARHSRCRIRARVDSTSMLLTSSRKPVLRVGRFTIEDAVKMDP
jgi:hypothetical protein